MSNYQDLDSLLALLKVAEELLFSFPMPNEVITKYEFIRGKTFVKCNLPYNGSHIRRLQLEAQAKLDKDSEKIINTSTLEVRDLELQNKLQHSTILIQKLLGLLDKSVKINEQIIYNCGMICNSAEFAPSSSKNKRKLMDLPLIKIEVDENDYEKTFEKYKLMISKNEGEVQSKLEEIEESIRSHNSYIKKLEQEITLARNGENKDKYEISENCENLRNRLAKEKFEYEKRIKELREELLLSKSSFLNEARKAQMKEIEKLMNERDMYQEQSDNLARQLESVSSSLQQEISALHDGYERNIQEFTYKLSSKNRETEISLKQKIEMLEKTLFYREKELLEELSKSSRENNSMIEGLERDLKFYKNNSEALQHCIDCVQSVVAKVYKKFSDKQEDFGDIGNTLMKQIEYLDAVVNKLTSDNNWLVDRISEVGKENESIKRSMRASAIKETITDLDTSSSVLKSFEASRERLKKKISEPIQQFPNTFSKLSHKYNNNFT